MVYTSEIMFQKTKRKEIESRPSGSREMVEHGKCLLRNGDDLSLDT